MKAARCCIQGACNHSSAARVGDAADGCVRAQPAVMLHGRRGVVNVVRAAVRVRLVALAALLRRVLRVRTAHRAATARPSCYTQVFLTSHVSTRVSLQLAAPATSRRHMTQPELSHAPRSRPNTSTRMLQGRKTQTVSVSHAHTCACKQPASCTRSCPAVHSMRHTCCRAPSPAWPWLCLWTPATWQSLRAGCGSRGSCVAGTRAALPRSAPASLPPRRWPSPQRPPPRRPAPRAQAWR